MPRRAQEDNHVASSCIQTRHWSLLHLLDETMRILSLRLIVALIIGVTLVSIASSWYEVRSQKDALQSDLERKSEVLGESLARTAELYLETGDRPGLEQMVRRFSNRDHLLGIGVYGRDGSALVVTPGLSAVLPGRRIRLGMQA